MCVCVCVILGGQVRIGRVTHFGNGARPRNNSLLAAADEPGTPFGLGGLCLCRGRLSGERLTGRRALSPYNRTIGRGENGS